MTGKIITISRQFGSGGRTIGHQLSQRLGIPCYDSQLLKKIAQQSGLSEAYVAKESESAGSGIFSFVQETDYYGYSNKLEIWKAQCQIIKDLASEGPCIIVGRCADYVLRDTCDLLKVYVYADKQFRQDRSATVYGEGVDNIAKYVKDNDKRRTTYYDVYTDQKFGDAKNYDLCLNSGRIGIDQCVDLIAAVYNSSK